MSSFAKKALVGFDVRAQDCPALAAALALRDRIGTEVEVLHVVDVPEPEDLSGRPDVVTQARRDVVTRSGDLAATRLSEAIEKVGSNADAQELLHVESGTPSSVLCARAREAQADVLFLGPHRSRGRFDYGSTARLALHTAPCPVWVQTTTPVDVKRVLCPTDLSPLGNAALDRAEQLARELEVPLTVMHAYTAPLMAYGDVAFSGLAYPSYVIDEERNAARISFDEAMASRSFKGLEVNTHFVEGDAAATILDEAEPSDVIVLGTHGRTGLSALLLGNVAYKVLREAECPVVAVRPKDLADKA